MDLRKRERERERERQTDRQTDRDRQRLTETDKDRDRQRQTDTDRDRDRQEERQRVKDNARGRNDRCKNGRRDLVIKRSYDEPETLFIRETDVEKDRSSQKLLSRSDRIWLPFMNTEQVTKGLIKTYEFPHRQASLMA